MKYRQRHAVASPSSLPFGGLFSFPFDFSQRSFNEAIEILHAWRLLHENGFRVVPPQPQARKGGRPPTFKMPELKAILLGQVLVEADSAAEKRGGTPPSNSELLRRLKRKGRFFPSHEHSTLMVELSKARKWAQSEAGQRWIEQAGEQAELYLQQPGSIKPPMPERRLAGTVSS